MTGPEVVTLCGSMRFWDRILRVAAEETSAGAVVLAPFVTIAPDRQDGDARKAALDELHRRKIDMSTRVVVVTDEAGYIGVSTRGEITYAVARGLPVEYRAVPSSGGAA